MKRVLRFLIHLYPAWWRRRYGRELEALLEDSGSRWRDVWDLFRGAMQMQVSKWTFAAIVAACGIVGLVLAGTVAFSMPYRYRSTATLKMDQSDSEWFAHLTQVALSRNALITMINDYNLYPSERRNRSMEDVADNMMRRAIWIRSVDPNLAQISFAYENPAQAQRVTENLIGRIISANVSRSINPNGLRIESDAPPDPPKRQIEGKRYGLAGLGLPTGMLFGVVLALILRRRKTAAS